MYCNRKLLIGSNSKCLVCDLVEGWKYSKMGDVVMRRLLPEGRLSQDFVTIIDSLGCRVPAMKSVCPEQPRQLDQLTTMLSFRAFMFQGSDRGAEMILSVRMYGCLQEEHCIQVCCF